jgi:nicotinate-nucleotide adenylyltransferase
MRKYAIYGGSFDPIHAGHISIADHAVKECGIDKLIFMPAHISPFKQDSKVTDGSERCAMIETILGYNKAFCLSRYEISKEGPSYTVETLRHWKNILDGPLYFVLGFDSLVQLDTWYMGPEIIRNYPLITARRPDTNEEQGMMRIKEFREKYGADITVLKMPLIDASSTDIRNLISEGREVKGLLAPEVEKYIRDHGLYIK